MTYSPEGYALTKSFEGCKLTAYQDQGGVWTIGYGTTNGVKDGDTCTISQAEEWLRRDVESAVMSVNKVVDEDAPLSQGQFDALVDFTYNLGSWDFNNSKLRAYVKMGMFDEAANEFKRWNHVNGKEVAGLTRRRLAEEQMFRGEGQ